VPQDHHGAASRGVLAKLVAWDGAWEIFSLESDCMGKEVAKIACAEKKATGESGILQMAILIGHLHRIIRVGFCHRNSLRAIHWQERSME